MEWYPSGKVLKAEKLEQHISELIAERDKKNAEYYALKTKCGELSKAKRDLDEYLRQEQDGGQQKNRKRNDLE